MTAPNPLSPEMEAMARGLTKAQRAALEAVCRTNGGGVRVRCRVGDDGYGIPLSKPMARLHELGLIQGKAGGCEIVVHTREGFKIAQAIRSNP